MVLGGRRRGRRGLVASAAVGLLALTAACSDAPELVQRAGVSSSTSTAGTTSSPEAQRADAALTGKVVHADGTPMPDQTVTVVRTDTGVGGQGALTAVFTLGLSCVADPSSCSSTPKVVDSGRTAADGTFETTLPHAYLAGYETNDDWVLSVTLPPAAGQASGPVSSLELEVNTAVQEAPTLPVWDVAPKVTPEGQLLSVTLARPSAISGAFSTSVQLLTEGNQVLWQMQGQTLDPRVLEDLPVRAVGVGSADVRVSHVDGRTIYHQRLASAAVAYQGPGAPPSRGSACTLKQAAALGCTLTDGDLSTAQAFTRGRVATVDLGRAEPVGLVVVRGQASPETMTVEVSADGASWHTFRDGALGGARGVVATGDSTARYVRLTAADRGAVSEVSVWPPLPKAVAGPSGLGRDAASGSDTGRLLAAVAAALLAGLVGGVGVSRWRRARAA